MSTEPLRMSIWLAIGLTLYFTALSVIGPNAPAAQTIFYKAGHVTTLSWIGYWISRQAIGRVKADSSATEKLARAVLIAGVILAGSMGM